MKSNLNRAGDFILSVSKCSVTTLSVVTKESVYKDIPESLTSYSTFGTLVSRLFINSFRDILGFLLK
jgi:hypothetical protein